MDEINFRKWLQKNNYSKKMQSDFVSRIKRIEKEIDHCDIDSEYRNDRCVNLLRYFEKNGCNEYMSQIKNCDNKKIKKAPIAVLIDNNTGSSGELTALCFKGIPNVKFWVLIQQVILLLIKPSIYMMAQHYK